MSVKDQGLNHSLDRYHIVPRTLIFIMHKELVLLLKGAKDKKIWPNLYNGVGGHVEKDESILTSARRELKEEVGLTELSDLYLIGTIHIDTSDPNLGILLFVFKGTTPTRNIRKSEEGTPEWVNWTTIDKESVVKDLPLLMPYIMSASPKSRLFHARYWYNNDNQLQADFTP